MIDPVDGCISGRTTVDIFLDARHPQPLRALSLGLRITPPSCHFFSRVKFRALAHVESSRDYSICSKRCIGASPSTPSRPARNALDLARIWRYLVGAVTKTVAEAGRMRSSTG